MDKMKKYGETDTDRWARDMIKSREIVSEVLNFGISQNQIHQIIKLLSLELEDRGHLLEYTNLVKKITEPESDLETTESNSASRIIME